MSFGGEGAGRDGMPLGGENTPSLSPDKKEKGD